MPLPTLIVTRPAAQAAGWVQRLRALGVPAQALPLIDIAPLADTAPLREAWRALPGSRLVMFVSANAVQHFLDAREGRPWPAGVWAGSTGPGTSAALREAGVPEDLLVEPPADAPSFDSEALWHSLQRRHPGPWTGQRAWIVRGEHGRDWLAETLRGQGATLGFIAAYRRLPPQPDAAGAALLGAALASPARHAWHFSSSEAIGHLGDLVRARGGAPDWAAHSALASHPRIAQTARDAGFGSVLRVGARPEDVAQALQPSATGAPSLESGRP